MELSKTSKSRYEYLGEYLQGLLNIVAEDIQQYIALEIRPKLPDLHSSEKGVCKDVNLGMACNTLKDCAIKHQQVSNCLENRPIHLEVWLGFLDYVLKKAIPNALQIQTSKIRKINSTSEYKTVLIDILKTFSETLKRNFIQLHNHQIKSHRDPIDKLKEYKLTLVQSFKDQLKTTGTSDCVKMLEQSGWKSLKSIASSLGLDTSKHRGNITNFSKLICSVEI